MEIMKIFFECYFHQNEGFDCLDEIIQNLKSSEYENYRLQLIRELHQIIHTKNYVLASNIIKKYGGRCLNLEKTEKLINFLYNRFTDRQTDVKPEDFKKNVKIVFCPVCCPDPEVLITYSLIQKATICGKGTQIFICKPCKLVWTTEDIRADNAQNYKAFMKSLDLKGFWNELCNVDLL